MATVNILACFMMVVAMVAAGISMDEADAFRWQDNEIEFGMSPKKFFTIRSWDDIDDRANSEDAKEFVDQKVEVYNEINPAHAVSKISDVANMLRLAYAGAKGFHSSSPVLQVMSGYQDLVKDSLISSSSFVEIILRALKYHKYSLLFLSKKSVAKSLKYLKKCSSLAEKMASETQKLLDTTDDVSNKAVSALEVANEDYATDKNETDTLKKTIEEYKEAAEEQKKLKEDLEAKIQHELELELQSAAIDEDMDLWNEVTEFLGDEVPEGEEKEKLDQEKAKARIDYHEQQMENNAEMAATVARLLSAKAKNSTLPLTIYGLDMAIKTTKKVRANFEHAKVFWLAMKKTLDSLEASSEQLKDLSEDATAVEEFQKRVIESGYNWLTAGKIYRDSAIQIRKVDKSVDEAMSNLPDEKDAEMLVKTLGKKILDQIAEENKKIKDKIDSDKNKIKPTTQPPAPVTEEPATEEPVTEEPVPETDAPDVPDQY